MGCFVSKNVDVSTIKKCDVSTIKKCDVSTIKKCDVSTQTPINLSFEMVHNISKSYSRDSSSLEHDGHISYRAYRSSIENRNRLL